MDYHAVAQSGHGREEELQWARIVSTGGAARGVALVFIQKLCTAFHEFAPAWEAGALSPSRLLYFRERLAGRAQRVLDVLACNGLDGLDGVGTLRDLLAEIRSAGSMQALADLAEAIHQVNHVLCDALEQIPALDHP